MGDLKNKLNDIPQDFDREKLWTKIHSPKKKKRRFLWIWFLSLFAVSYFLISNLDQNSIQEANRGAVEKVKPAESNIEKSEVDKIENTISKNTITNDSNAKNSSVVSHYETEETKSLSNQNNQLVNNYNSSGLNYNNSRIKADLNDQFGNMVNAHTIGNSSMLNQVKIEPFVVDNKSSFEKISKEIIAVTSLNKLTVQLFEIESISPDRLIETDLDLYLKEREKHDLPFYLKIGIGVGLDNHEYKDALRINEKELETLTASIELEQFITKRFSLSGGLSYARNTTNLKFEQQQSSIAFSGSNLINDKYITNYNLYNNYSRFDLTLDLNYLLQFRKIVLSPSLGLGYNISSTVDGEILKDDRRLTPLSSLGYKKSSGTFGAIKLNIGYELNNKMILGLCGNIQSNRMIDADEIHSITPYHLTVFAKKSF